MDQKKIDHMIIRYLLLTALVVLVVRYFEHIIGFARLFLGVLTPLLFGAVIAYVLNLVMKVVERFYFPETKNSKVIKSRRPVSIILSFLLVVAAISLIISMVVPELVNAFQVIFSELPGFLEKIEHFVLDATENNPGLHSWIMDSLKDISWDEIDWAKTAETLLGYASAGVSGILTSAVSIFTTVAGGVVELFIALIFSVYLLANKETLADQAQRILQAYLSEKRVVQIDYVLETANNAFSGFIEGQCVEAVVLGSLCAIGMWILRLPYAPMIGALVGVTALIPIVGAYIGAAVGAFMILTVNPVQAIVFLIYLLVLQQLEGNLIYPKVVGASIGLPGMWVLAAITLGGGLAGIPGMLFGVPTAATLYRLLSNDVKNRNTAKKSQSAEMVKEEESEDEA
ncbi:MAG: AI-2E family transporter [Lachnospiraceae bacterium]|nr:AI-2E family transporter [Lachnospiraceae bacterium]